MILQLKNLRPSPALVLAASVLSAMIGLPAWGDSVEVQVHGIDNPLKDNVRKSLSVAGKHKKPWSADQIQRLYRLAPKQIKRALQPYGYFNPKIQMHLEKPSDDSKSWTAVFKIKHGPPVRIEHLNLKAIGPGDQLPGVRKAIRNTQLQRGQRLVESDYSDTKGALHDAAYQAGYLDAHFTQSTIRVNPKTNAATIDLVLDTGERYYFGPVTFKQNLLNDRFLHRFVPFKPGQPYDAQKLIKLQLALSKTNYFSQIQIQAPRDQARQVGPLAPWFYDLLFPLRDPLAPAGRLQVPVTVAAKPSKPQHYRISAGYGTDTGPRLGLGVKFRHLNKYGHQFSANLRISQIQRTALVSYDIPIGNVASDKLSFNGTVSNEQYGDITSMLYGVGVVRNTGWKFGRQRFYLKFKREYYNLGHGTQQSTLLYPGYNIALQRADNLLFTHKGLSLSLDVRGTTSAIVSSTSFFRADFNAHVIFPVTSKIRVLMRTELGAIQASHFSKVPPSQRFFAGGESSVRGYSYQSISPTNSKNKDIGGRYLATASFETDYFFYKKFGVAAFFDAGDAADTLHLKLKTGAGIGFRYASPVGMVHLDFARPLNASGKGFFIGFSLGADL